MLLCSSIKNKFILITDEIIYFKRKITFILFFVRNKKNKEKFREIAVQKKEYDL
jgi:hypothetical protein